MDTNDPYSTALALRALALVKPDLSLTSTDIAALPLSPAVGENITVSATVRNTGLEMADNITVRLLDNGVAAGEQTVAAISPGGSTAAAFAVNLTPYGDHTFSIVIDPGNSVTETSETNNIATLRIWAKAPADLVVMPGYISVSPTYPKPGETVTLTANIANMGEINSGAFDAELYDGDPNNGGIKLGSFAIPGIFPGQSVSGSVTFSLTATGAHTLHLVVDPINAIPEASEENNRTAKEVTVSASTGTGFTDLTIPAGGLAITPQRPASGETVTVTLLAGNLSTENTTAEVEIFDGDPAAGGVLVHKSTVNLSAAETRTVTASWQITTGIHTLWAYIDRANAVTERDENNNRQSLAVMADMVDIEVSASDISITPEHPMDGDPATVNVVIQNRGIASTGAFNVNLYNGDPASGGTLLQSYAITDLAGDATQTISYPFTAARGTYRFYAVCDPENKVAELYEQNNLAIRSLLVKTSAEAKGPDLVPLEFDLSGAVSDPQSLRVSGVAKVKFQNKGDDKVMTPFRITVFEDKDGDGVHTEGTDLALGWWDYSAPMNPSMVGTVNINLSGTLAFLDAPIYAMLDSGQSAFEQNETNNTIRKGSACENRPANPIQPTLKWQWRGEETTCGAFAIRPPIVIGLTDDNSDGKIDGKDTPSVIFLTQDKDYCWMQPKFAQSGNGMLKALNGKTGQELFTTKKVNNLDGFIAAGDMNNDGKPEIIITVGSWGLTGVMSYSNDGYLLWDNAAAMNKWHLDNGLYTLDFGSNRAHKIADIDGDGSPEIISGATVLNSNGSVRFARLGVLNTGRGNSVGGIHGASAVADLDMNGKQEVVAGNTAYNADGTIKWFNQALPDGMSLIANFDDDPYPEIVLASESNDGFNLYLLEHDGSVKWGPVKVASIEGAWPYGYGGVPTVADFDGDGQPEIGMKGYGNYLIIDRDGRLVRMLPIPRLVESARVAATVFDLNSDGRPEIIIYSDQFLRIFDGKTGTLVHEDQIGTTKYGYFLYQGVIVADVDGDGHAELVVTGLDFTAGTNNSEQRVKVYGAKNNDWQNTRRIWNQPGYHVTNVNDDGTIPRYETPSWLTNNSYHCNVPTTTGPNPYLAADISTSFVRVDMAGYPASIAITARVGNGGAKVVVPGVKAYVYDGDPANGGILIGSALTTKTLEPGQFEDVTVVWSAPAPGNHAITVKVDPDGTIAECDKANNTVSLQTFVTAGRADPSIAAEDITVQASIPEGSLTGVVMTVRNLGTLQADNVLVRLYAGNPASGGRQIGTDRTIPAIAAGGTETVTFTWDTLGAQGITYLYALVDPSAAITDVNRGNNTAFKLITVSPSDKPDLVISAGDIAVTPAGPTEGDVLTIAVDVHNRGISTGNVRVALYNGNPAAGGKLLQSTIIPQLIPFGGTSRATLALDTVGLFGTVSLFVKLDPDNAIEESDEMNNVASGTVTINPAGLTVGMAADKPSYSANDSAVLTVSIADLKAQARSLACDVQIVDSYGVVAAVAAADSPLQLAASSSMALPVSWNTGTTYSGAYTVIATVKENGRVVSKAAAPLTILPVKTAAAAIFVDKLAYSANELVTIAATVSGTSPNYIFTDMSARITVLDPAGESLFAETRAIPALANGQRIEVKSYWNTLIFAPGSYPTVIEVKDSSGAVIATGTTSVGISSIVKPSAVLKGDISVDKQSLFSGEAVNVSYNLKNVGNQDLSSVAVSVLTVHVANETVYDTLTYQTSLPKGAVSANSGEISTANYNAKDYLVVLRANIDGVEETLAGTYFRVEGAPSAPALYGPAQGADLDTFTATLSVSNAADPNDDRLSYQFEIYSDSGLATVIDSGIVSETAGYTAWTASALLTENQSYYWRARAFDSLLYGPWMSPASFRVNTANDLPSAPTISSPVDESAVAELAPLLTVNNATDPDSASLTYNFEIALDQGFTQVVASATGVSSDAATTSWLVPENLHENGTYYWRAQADDWLIEGPWSTTARFFVNTANDAPATPVVIEPASGSTIANLATDVIVVNSTDPDSPELWYFFEADTVTTFDSGNIIRSESITEGQGATLWHLTGLQDNTQYYLRVKASDGTADSPWSLVSGLFANTANDAPTMPTPENPSNGAGVKVFSPVLSVHNAADLDQDALSYEFEVYSDPALTNLIARAAGISETPQLTGWQIPLALAENGTYYWRSRAFDGALYGDWTPAASFLVNTANDAPSAPRLAAPADGSGVVTTMPVLSVTNATDPDSDSLTYEFEIYAGGVLAGASAAVPGNVSGITTWTPGTPLTDNTVYQWRARANDGDSYGAWMDMAAFTVHVPKTSISATVDFDPDTLNQSSKGTWVVVYIELPDGYKPADVDISSIRLEGSIPAETKPYGIGDHDKDGIPDLMVKFKRSDLINLLSTGDKVIVQVTGKVGSMIFEGVDVIRVIK